jgi:uncharacterized protein (DUF302 family)/uncharacterized membrane protein YidH (DUF202 family)
MSDAPTDPSKSPRPPADSAAPEAASGDPRDFLAAERTFLAWIRTGIALMGFGFILARFGLFLRQIAWLREAAAAQQFGASVWLGVALVSLGVAVNVAATARHVHFVRALREGRGGFHRPSRLAIAMALILAGIGIITALYLVIVSRSLPAPNAERVSMPPQDVAGLVSVPSHHSVDETVVRLQKVLAENGVQLFALIDHSGEAQKAGLSLRPTKLLIFGSPKAGTPLMAAAPSMAIDLPLKLLVWQEDSGQVWISYNAPEYLRDRHHLPPELTANIAVVSALAANAGE